MKVLPLPKTKFNLCTYVIMPLVGLKYSDINNNHLINAYISVGDNTIAISESDLEDLEGMYTFVLVLKYKDEVPRGLTSHIDCTKCIEDDGSVSYMFEYPIPQENQIDVVNFLRGNWHNFSNSAINKIENMWDDTVGQDVLRVLDFIVDEEIRRMYSVRFMQSEQEIFEKPDFPMEYYFK